MEVSNKSRLANDGIDTRPFHGRLWRHSSRRKTSKQGEVGVDAQHGGVAFSTAQTSPAGGRLEDIEVAVVCDLSSMVCSPSTRPDCQEILSPDGLGD